jgi:hypothetical protein
VTRRSVTVGVLALVLLAVGALSVTFVDRVAGQSASAEASATASASACAGESGSALDQDLPVGTCIPAEVLEDTFQAASTGSENYLSVAP